MNLSIIAPVRSWVLPALAVGLGYLVFFLFPAAAQLPPLIVQSWQTENGLPHNVLTDAVQGGDGYLWIGTFNGLARFDGAHFRVFNSENTPALTDSWIDHVFVTPDGTLWIGTHHGGFTSYRAGQFRLEMPVRLDEDWVIKYVGQRQSESVFLTAAGRLLSGTPGAMRLLPEPAPMHNRDAVMDSHGVIWFFGSGRLEGRLVGDQFEAFGGASPQDDLQCNDLCVDTQGRLWLGNETGLSVWGTNEFTHVTPGAGEPPLMVKHLYACHDGGVWADVDGRFRKWREHAWIVQADEAGPSFKAPVTGVREDLHGDFWFSSFGDGLWRLASDGRTLRVSTVEGLPNSRVASICVDSENNLWVALDRGGLARVRGRRFSVVQTTDAAAEPAAVSVCEDGTGALWIGTFGDGLVCLESNRVTRFTSGLDGSQNLEFASDGSKGYVMSVLADQQGRVWAGTEGRGVFWLTNQLFATAFSIEKIGWQARVICEDHVGRIWLGNSLGLYRWENGSLEACVLPAGVLRLEVRAILDDGAGGVWVGSRGKGLFRFQNGRWQTWRQSSGLGSDTVWTIFAEDSKTLWLGTQAGLVRFKDGQFTRLTKHEGLPSDAIYHLMADGQGWLWAASQNGIFRVRREELDDFAMGKIAEVNCLNYDWADGLPTLQCSVGSQPAGWRSRDDKLWFTTEKGVVEVDAGNLRRNTQSPPVLIEDMRVDDVAQTLPEMAGDQRSGDSVRDLKPVLVAPGRERVEFGFTALSFTAPEKVKFHYRLEGLESKWFNADSQRFAQYSSLPPGKYTFHVIACNDDGVWNETGASLPFVVLPWFWQTAWFKGMIGLVVLAGTVAIVWRVESRRTQRKLAVLERERELDRERARIARDIHDDLGASVTQLGFLGDLTSQNADRPEAVRRHSQRISGAAREMAQALDAIVWAVKPENDTARNLIEYLQRRTNELLENLPGRYTFSAPTNIPNVVVAAEVRHNIFLAYKEALANILKHAQASEVAIEIVIQADRLQIVVRDNGRGFDPLRGRPDGSGQKNMRRRLEEIGGHFEIQSQPGTGTRLQMRIPLTGKSATLT